MGVGWGAPGAWQGVELDDGRDAEVLERWGVVGRVEHPLPVAVRPDCKSPHQHAMGRCGSLRSSCPLRADFPKLSECTPIEAIAVVWRAHQLLPRGRSELGDVNAMRRPGTMACMSPF